MSFCIMSNVSLANTARAKIMEVLSSVSILL